VTALASRAVAAEPKPIDPDRLAELRSIIGALAKHGEQRHVVQVRSPVIADILDLLADRDGLASEVARLRARVRVEAEDVERAGVTWAHVEECLKRSDPEIDIARLRRLWGAGIERLIDQIARNESVSPWAILDEMAAMPVEAEQP
jgi:chorismate mutase